MGSELVGLEKKYLFKDLKDELDGDEDLHKNDSDEEDTAVEAEEGYNEGSEEFVLNNSDGSSSISMNNPSNRIIRDRHQTGPKGVIADYKDAKLRMRIQMKRDRELRLNRMEELTRGVVDTTPSTSFSSTGDKRGLVIENIINGDNARRFPDYTRNSSSDSEDSDDTFFRNFRERRLREMKWAAAAQQYGESNEVNGDQFLKELASAQKLSPPTTVIVHIYDGSLSTCRLVNAHFRELAIRHPQLRFISLRGSEAMHDFDPILCPAINIYNGDTLVKSHFKITDDLGDDFTSQELEWILGLK